MQNRVQYIMLFSERAKRAKLAKLTLSRVQLRFQIYIYTSGVLEHKWRASLIVR